MDSKQMIESKKEVLDLRETTLREVSDQLADIELKIDHLIERIHDSLYRLNHSEEGECS